MFRGRVGFSRGGNLFCHELGGQKEGKVMRQRGRGGELRRSHLAMNWGIKRR